jgi:hypothetical protein
MRVGDFAHVEILDADDFNLYAKSLDGNSEA